MANVQTYPVDQYPARTAILGVGLAHAIFKHKSAPLDMQQRAREVLESHPDWNTPNWCDYCTPLGLGYCRCPIASNE